MVGVIGDPVAHSLSPRLHNAAFAAMGLDWVAVAFQVREGEAPAAVGGARALGIRGLSVTMPHKAAVVGGLDRLTTVAAALGAVNCIWRDGPHLVGDNTDGEGFLESLARGASFDPAGRRCVVVGSGGAARAVVRALAGAGAAVVSVVGRAPDRAAGAAGLAGPAGRVGVAGDAADADLVVEATPVGMAGTQEGSAPSLVDPRLLGPGQLAVDLVYAPAVTPWLAAARAAGATGLGGLGMLVHQAAAQVTRWTAAPAPTEAMWAAVAGAGSGPLR